MKENNTLHGGRIMNTRRADLHIHSYYSDGTLSPQEIVEIGGQKKKKRNTVV